MWFGCGYPRGIASRPGDGERKFGFRVFEGCEIYLNGDVGGVFPLKPSLRVNAVKVVHVEDGGTDLHGDVVNARRCVWVAFESRIYPCEVAAEIYAVNRGMQHAGAMCGVLPHDLTP